MRNACSVTDPGESKSESDLNSLPRLYECCIYIVLSGLKEKFCNRALAFSYICNCPRGSQCMEYNNSDREYPKDKKKDEFSSVKD